MTATEELRRLLDEHGVEYQAIGKRLTYWNRDGSSNDCDDADIVADEQNGSLTVEGLTPEQAVAATLGPDYEPPIAARWDGDVLVLTMPRDPSSVHVQRAEGQSRKVYPEEATLGSGTCKVVSKPCDMWECECGKAWWHGGAPNYCPNCGAKVVEG